MYLRGQLDAFRPQLVAALVLGAVALVQIEIATGHVGVVDLAGVLVLVFVQAAFAAAVAQRLPFALGHLRQGLGFPERRGVGGLRLDGLRLGGRLAGLPRLDGFLWLAGHPGLTSAGKADRRPPVPPSYRTSP